MSISTITIGGINYTAYASLAEADAYLAADPTRAAAWAALTVDQKGVNLVAATRRLDLLEWSGTPLSDTQTTDWPRENATCSGKPVTSTDVPIEIENGTILQAGSIALAPDQSNAGTSGSNIRRVAAGSAEVEFFRPTIPGLALQDETVFQLVHCLLAGADGTTGVGFGIASGTGGQSIFEDPDAPGLNEGFP